MKWRDGLAFILFAGGAAFFAFPGTRELYQKAYAFSPGLLSFGKFALLATAGEMLILRLRSGRYLSRNFGLLPKMLVWGVLGVLIYCVFVIFSAGVPALVFRGAPPAGVLQRIAAALLISVFMNIIFAPPMMLVHHLSDIFIADNEGRFPLRSLNVRLLLAKADWDKLWGFVYKRTIPLFWIPAHTITFLLPPEFRVLFAALLSVVLGLFLALASRREEVV